MENLTGCDTDEYLCIECMSCIPSVYSYSEEDLKKSSDPDLTPENPEMYEICGMSEIYSAYLRPFNTTDST